MEVGLDDQAILDRVSTFRKKGFNQVSVKDLVSFMRGYREGQRDRNYNAAMDKFLRDNKELEDRCDRLLGNDRKLVEYADMGSLMFIAWLLPWRLNLSIQDNIKARHSICVALCTHAMGPDMFPEDNAEQYDIALHTEIYNKKLAKERHAREVERSLQKAMAPDV